MFVYPFFHTCLPLYGAAYMRTFTEEAADPCMRGNLNVAAYLFISATYLINFQTKKNNNKVINWVFFFLTKNNKKYAGNFISPKFAYLRYPCQ